jgi:hypothetical protein
MPWNTGNKLKKEVESAFRIIASDTEGKSDKLLTFLAFQDQRQPNMQKLRRLMGLPKPMTRKHEKKLFNQLRKLTNEYNKKIIIRKSGAISGVYYEDDNGHVPTGRAAIRHVLQQAAKYVGAGAAKDGVAASNNSSDGIAGRSDIQIPEPGVSV